MNPYRMQIFEVVDAAADARLAVIAHHWYDAIDIYARIYGLNDYRHWMQTGRGALTVLDRRGERREQRWLMQ